MGTYYAIYAEVRVGNKWYNISPLMRNEDGEVRVQPIMSGQSVMHDAAEEMEGDCYMRGRPANLSEELKTVYGHEDHETSEHLWRGMTYGEYYRQTLYVVNYGKSVKSRVKAERPARYMGYVNKYCLSEYEIGSTDTILNWISEKEYLSLPENEKCEYTYYEWNEWDDWYGIYSELVQRVDCMLNFFNAWAFYHLRDADPDERSPSADYVRLIVYRG